MIATKTTWVRMWGLVSLSVSSVVAGVALGAQPPIVVQVYGEHKGDNVVYHYSVTNVSSVEFNNFIIGSVYDEETQDSIPQLGVLPANFEFGPEGEGGEPIILDPASTTQPANWEPWCYGSGLFSLQWQIRYKSSTRGPQSGQTVSGFSVTVPNIKDRAIFPNLPPSYLKYYYEGGFEVGIYPGPDYFGQIDKMDTSAPEISLRLSADTLWPPNGKMIPVTATVSAKDDYDGEPEIKLESITANEPLGADDIADAQFGTDDRQFQLKADRLGTDREGRTYTVTYSATDATGNKSTASATVTVPHDRR